MRTSGSAFDVYRQRRPTVRLSPRLSGIIRVRSSCTRTNPGTSPRGEQSSPSGPLVASEQNGEASKKEIKDTLQQMPDSSNYQLSIFETVDPIAGKLKEALEDLELNNMTPIECMMKLNELKKMLED